MPSVTVPEVAQLLREFGQPTALRGGNRYRAKAYTRAAENLLALTEPLEDLIAQNRLNPHSPDDALILATRAAIQI
jgi:DNA polymerase (family X)